MSVTAIAPDYEKYVEFRDVEKNFHGNRVVYVHWEEHLSFCSAIAFPLPPAMPFAVSWRTAFAPSTVPGTLTITFGRSTVAQRRVASEIVAVASFAAPGDTSIDTKPS